MTLRFRDASCEGTVRFRSYLAAAQVQKRKTRTPRGREVYHCEFCGGYHLGKPLAFRRRLRLELQREAEELSAIADTGEF